MSRCFPYPPPGYERLATGHEALIESIKLQRGETAKKDRKDKESKKKDREKNRQNGEIDKNKRSHKKRHKGERSHNEQKGQEHRTKRRKSETEQSEKSSLTEEHGHPVSSQNLSNSSDSTLNSSKRQKHRPAPDGGHNPGSTMRIRLPLQRQKDTEEPQSIERPCTALTTDIFVQEKVYSSAGGKDDVCSTSTSTSKDLTFALSEKKPYPSSETPKTLASKSQTSPFSRLYGSNNPLDSKFRELIENWAPPLSQSECVDIEHQEWLFPTKLNVTFEARSFKAAASGSSSRESSGHWSQVCYLSEADVYALPFTLPF